MVVAQIAYDRLTPGAQKWANGLLKNLDAPKNVQRSFVQAATWPDQLKGFGISVYNAWHYTNIPLETENVVAPCDAAPAINVVWAIQQSQYVLDTTLATPSQKSLFLSFLIHFVGDLHQPLHSTSMYSIANKKGDLGGNKFALNDKDNDNLHSLWDDGCGYFDTYGKIKADSGNWQVKIKSIASAVTLAYPAATITDLQNLSPKVWANESHVYAVSTGFQGFQSAGLMIKPNDSPSVTYLQSAQKVVGMRLATAGYRLATILNAIYAKRQGK